MTRYYAEQVLVTLFGFLLGATLAMCITPGDVLLWIATGAILGIFCHVFFIRDFGGELLWPFLDYRPFHRRKNDRLRPTAGTTTAR